MKSFRISSKIFNSNSSGVISTSAYKTETKPDRLPPEIIIEEVAQSEVNTSEVVTNIATKSDGTIIIPE